jgi:hypothetical protein
VLVVGRLAKLFPEPFSGVGRLDSHTLGYGATGRKPGDRCTTPAVQGGSAGHWKPGEAGVRGAIGPAHLVDPPSDPAALVVVAQGVSPGIVQSGRPSSRRRATPGGGVSRKPGSTGFESPISTPSSRFHSLQLRDKLMSQPPSATRTYATEHPR